MPTYKNIIENIINKNRSVNVLTEKIKLPYEGASLYK